MDRAMPFHEVLESIEQMSLDDQETLMEIVRRRVAERGRKRLVAEIQDARREFAEGSCRPSTADELVDEILS